MSESRRLLVLRAIVEDYVSTREPVGSKAIAERHNIDVSPATIRNDMAALEDQGLITAPHTSAGRIPTDQGYRTFVDKISQVRPLSRAERQAMSILAQSSGDQAAMLEHTVRLLATLTNQAAVVQFSEHTTATIRHIDVLQMAPHKALVIVILSSGRVHQRMVTLPEETPEDDLVFMGRQLAQKLYRRNASDVPLPVEQILGSVEPGMQDTMALCVHAVEVILDATRVDRIIMTGTANLAKSGDELGLSIAPILEAMEEQVVLLRLLHEMQQDHHGLAISIGAETSHASLAETAVVAAEYAPVNRGGDGAKLGVVGPTRMDYGTSMATVRAMARYLSRIFS